MNNDRQAGVESEETRDERQEGKLIILLRNYVKAHKELNDFFEVPGLPIEWAKAIRTLRKD
jgi:hypothetical protein